MGKKVDATKMADTSQEKPGKGGTEKRKLETRYTLLVQRRKKTKTSLPRNNKKGESLQEREGD